MNQALNIRNKHMNVIGNLWWTLINSSSYWAGRQWLSSVEEISIIKNALTSVLRGSLVTAKDSGSANDGAHLEGVQAHSTDQTSHRRDHWSLPPLLPTQVSYSRTKKT